MITFRLRGWLLKKLQQEKNRSKVIRLALEKYYGGAK
jgi:hypothetical protein